MTKNKPTKKELAKRNSKTVKELQELGDSPQLLKSYSNSKWIELYNRGTYKLSEDEVTS